MTFDQAVEIDKPAYHRLESGAVLRYEPADQAVYVLGYPTTPRSWREAPLYLLTVPSDGLGHHLGRRCPFCAEGARITNAGSAST